MIKTALSFLGALTLLSSAAAQPDSGDSLGNRLVAAVIEADLAKTRTLLTEWKATGKPWPIGPDDKPLLFLAIEGRDDAHPQIIEFLLANGADVAARGPLGMTALHWAAANGYVERTEQILKHRPSLEATDSHGRTPLLVAHRDAAEKLLAAGANVRASDKDGMTALHYAAQSGSAHLALLFDAGFTEVDARSKAGVTPLHIAAIEGVESAAAWLLDRGAKLDAAVASDYEYLPHKMAPGYGNEMRIKRGSTALRLAADQHRATKWSSGRHRAVADLLKARAKTR
jgi:ankyrin repeat protein